MFCLVNITVPDEKTAQLISSTLVDEKLAACVSASQKIKSTYRWQGNIEVDDEILLIAKTRQELFEKLGARVNELHPYEVPEIVATAMLEIDSAYEAWLDENLERLDG